MNKRSAVEICAWAIVTILGAMEARWCWKKYKEEYDDHQKTN